MRPVTRSRREERRKEAEKRQAAYDALSREQKIAKLDERSHVAKRERARLEKT
jgi:hypothetical protein